MYRIYNKILETLNEKASVFEGEGLPVPAVVDVFAGQPSNPEQFEFALPAVFFDYSADYEGETLYVYLHVLTDFMEDTENIAPNRNKGLDYFRFLNLVKRCIKGIKIPPVFGALLLYQETPVQTEYFNYHQLTFRCALHDELDEHFPKYRDEEFESQFSNGKLIERFNNRKP
jgi:hypothetical protein